MKYPKLNGKSLNKETKARFDKINKLLLNTINFDNNEFLNCKLTEKDEKLICWNMATELIHNKIL